MPIDAEKWLQEQIDSGAIPDNDGNFHYVDRFSDVIKKERVLHNKNERLSDWYAKIANA